MNSYYVFSDEAGTYQRRPSVDHIRSHPFYIRSNVVMATDDYRQFQSDIKRVREQFKISYSEEIKWSDLWSKKKNKPRNVIIDRMSEKKLYEYYRAVFDLAHKKVSTKYIFTVSTIERSNNMKVESFYKLHLQDAFQRVQMDMKSEGGFATFVVDDLSDETVKHLKKACHDFATQGDYVNYKNLYQGVLIENSLYSPGIQLADYSAGVMNGYLRKVFKSPSNYQYAADLFAEFIAPRLRKYNDGRIVGYGVINIPKNPEFRQKLINVFESDDHPALNEFLKDVLPDSDPIM